MIIMPIKRNSDSANMVIKQINERYGEAKPDGTRQTVISKASNAGALEILRLPSDILVADIATGGGIPIGKVTGIVGPYSSGKTLLAMKYVVSAQHTCRYCKTRLSEKTGKIVLNKKTGEVRDVRDFLSIDDDFWVMALSDKKTKKFAKIAFKSLFEDEDSEESKSARKSLRDLMKGENLFFEEDIVYDCKCGKSEPMRVLWIDIEGTFDPVWAKKVGVDIEELVVSEPSAAEHAVDQTIHVINSGEYDLCVLDSLGNFITIDDIDKSAEENSMISGAAKLVNRFQRRMSAAMTSKRNINDPFQPVCSIIQINHVTTRIKKSPMDFGPSTVRPGGVVQEYNESLTLHMSNAKYDSHEDPKFVDIGFRTVKNKTFPPKKVASFKFWLKDDSRSGVFSGNTEEEKTVIKYAIDGGIINKVGAKSPYSYEYKDLKMTSESGFIEHLKQNSSLFREIRDKTFLKFVERSLEG